MGFFFPVSQCNLLILIPAVKVVTHTWSSFLSYSLADAGGVHLEEGVVHEEVEGLLLPGTAGVLVPTEAAQQLDAGPVAGGVVSTVRRNRKILKHARHQLRLHLPSEHEEITCMYSFDTSCVSPSKLLYFVT